MKKKTLLDIKSSLSHIVLFNAIHRSCIVLQDVNINKVVVSNKISSAEKTISTLLVT